jgi:hypothetical protein
LPPATFWLAPWMMTWVNVLLVDAMFPASPL